MGQVSGALVLQYGIMKNGMTVLFPESFPELLSEIPDAPKKLYVRGTLPKKSTKLLCVVGSRKYSAYGKDVCERLISELAGFDVAIVSGLAFGIDSIAHRAALAASLTTLAIPGSGLHDDVLYPRSHIALAKQIHEAGGALISEFEPDTKAAPYTFPQRNRIMAGISNAVLVIEATAKSGTLITSRLAQDYNRDVLTVPGSIYSSNSAGPHMLIKLGATPITCGDDILEALGIHPEEKVPQVMLENLSKREQSILTLLDTPMTRDELIIKLELETQEINRALSAMEIKGFIALQLGKIHRRI